MAHLDLEEAYYKALQAAKLSESTDRSPGCSNQAFELWARKVDIYDLDKERADFSLDEEIVGKFGEYRRDVEKVLSKSLVYDGRPITGHLETIGSCRDGSKVGKMNEVDSLYVVEGENIIVEQTDKPGIYRMFLEGQAQQCEVAPRSMRRIFADAYCNAIATVPLPGCLEHGGYNSPAYSGLRYNGPAATSQFLTRDGTLLTWDITPVFCLPKSTQIYRGLRKKIQPFLKSRSDIMFNVTVHIIPDALENVWRLSTAQMEAEILRVLDSHTPLMQALCYCKILASMLKKWNSKNLWVGVRGECCYVDIPKELEAYSKVTVVKHSVNEILNRKLRFAHIWIPPGERRGYNEDEKSYISINTAAIKHILLNDAFKHPEAFVSEKNMELVVKLMQGVFNTLGNPYHLSSPHAFLHRSNIPHLSVLASLRNGMTLAMDMKTECRVLLALTMQQVNQI